MPITFEDDIHLLSGNPVPIARYLQNAFKIKTFNFHPIHLYINTDKIMRYEQAKQYTPDPSMLEKYINTESYGIGDIFKELILIAKEKNYTFKKMMDFVL